MRGACFLLLLFLFIDITYADTPMCAGTFTCPGCYDPDILVTYPTTGYCNPPTHVRPASAKGYTDESVTVVVEDVNVFFTVTCQSDAAVVCNPLAVTTFSNEGDCLEYPMAQDYLRIDQQQPTYDCDSAPSTCTFTSAPSDASPAPAPYYYLVNPSNFPFTAGSPPAGQSCCGTASSPDCICQTLDVSPTPSGSPICPSFAQSSETPNPPSVTSPSGTSPGPGRTTPAGSSTLATTAASAGGTPPAGRRSDLKRIQRKLIELNATHPERIHPILWDTFFKN